MTVIQRELVNTASFEGLMQALTLSEENLPPVEKARMVEMKSLVVRIQGQCAAHVQRNQELQGQLQSSVRLEEEGSHEQQKVMALVRLGIDHARRELEEIQRVQTETAQKASEQIAIFIAQKAEEVQRATATGNQRVIDAQREAEVVQQRAEERVAVEQRAREQALAEALQRNEDQIREREQARVRARAEADQRVAAALAQAQAAEVAAAKRVEEAARARRVSLETQVQNSDTDAMQAYLNEANSIYAWGTERHHMCFSGFPYALVDLRTLCQSLISERRSRVPAEHNRALQSSDSGRLANIVLYVEAFKSMISSVNQPLAGRMQGLDNAFKQLLARRNAR